MKKFYFFLSALLGSAVLYAAGSFVYVQLQMRPLRPIAAPSALVSLDKRPQVHLIHAVNSIRRAQAKDAYFEGFEIDINRVSGRLMLAHDETEFEQAIPLSSLFEAIENPQTKTYWLDLKTELTQEDVNEIKRLAAQYGISPRKLLFETDAGETADLLNANGLPILLRLPNGFEDDEDNAQKRTALNAEMTDLLRRYHPFAIAGSLGKYPYLRAYFPQYNKAIYSATTVRPSLKKKFLKDAMFQDPTVLLFMQDQYTVWPF